MDFKDDIFMMITNARFRQLERVVSAVPNKPLLRRLITVRLNKTKFYLLIINSLSFHMFRQFIWELRLIDAVTTGNDWRIDRLTDHKRPN